MRKVNFPMNIEWTIIEEKGDEKALREWSISHKSLYKDEKLW